MPLPTAKIEERAISALQEIIDAHPTLQALFNKMDKEISYDGYIWLYNSLEEQSKENFENKIPFQIKGHLDNSYKYLKKQRITYSVSILDLKVFLKGTGLLYFLVFMTTDGKEKSIFYSSMFPSKIKTYLANAERKGNRKTINVVFTKLNNNSNELLSVLKQFNAESKKQGYGEGPIVQRTVLLNDLKKTGDISAEVIGATNGWDLFRRLAAGDVCFYVSQEGGWSVPIEWTDDFKIEYEDNVNQTISVGGRNFYNKYDLHADSDGGFSVILSENLEIDLGAGKFIFTTNSAINQLRTDAEFLLEATKNSKFDISGREFSYKRLSLPDEFVEELSFIVEIDDILKRIDLDLNTPFSSLSQEMLSQLNDLIAMKNGTHNDLLNKECHIYDWKLKDKYLPILVYRHTDDEKNDLYNEVYSEKYQLFTLGEDGKHYRIPQYVPLKSNVFANMYCYDYDFIKRQINCADINKFTFGVLVDSAVHLINAYDSTGEKNLLELAKYQMSKIEDFAGNDISFLINTMQIKVREGTFNTEDKKLIMDNPLNDSASLFCKNVLLKDKKNADKYFSLLTESEKEGIIGWPIMNLYAKI